MGAEVPYRVRVLVSTEDVVEVIALTESDAKEKAKSLPNVVAVVGIDYPAEDAEEGQSG